VAHEVSRQDVCDGGGCACICIAGVVDLFLHVFGELYDG
jgi:predicted patatin/cPLA2 family phospholipase